MKSKALITFMCMLMLAVSLAGCGGKPANGGPGVASQGGNGDYTGYEDYSEDGLGITLKLPSAYLANRSIVPGRYEVMFGDPSQLDAPKAETDPTDHLDLFFMPQKGQYCLFRVLAYPATKWDGWLSSGKKAADITKSPSPEEIFRKDGMVYIYDQPTVDTSAFDSSMKADYDTIMKMLPNIKASIQLKTVAFGDLGTFTTKDLNDRVVDSSIFAGHKLTMINIWATFCQPCIQELPDLQKMSENMPDGTQLISIVGDADSPDTLKLAQRIVRDAGVSFTCIVTDSSLKQYLDSYMAAYPTTLFVDSEGKAVGEPIVGERDMSVYRDVLSDRLAKVGR